jgi:sulfate adenylyltransferase subunit 2
VGTRQLTVEELNRQRRQAVQLRLEGQTLAQVAEATGLSTPTIISAVKAFKLAGWGAVTVNPRRGRPVRGTESLTGALELELLQAMLAGQQPWSVSAILDWVAGRGLVLSRSGALQWCRRTGLYDPEHALPAGRPGTSAFALYSLDLEVPPALHSTLGARLVSRVAVDTRGQVRWRLFRSDDIPAPEHADFFERLRVASRGRLRLEMPGARALLQLPAVASWAEQHAVSIEDAAVAPRAARATLSPYPPSGQRLAEKPTMNLTHLQRLEAESIHIMREVVAEADNPVMLYSIGKDSAVMLHLAMKAFHPAKPPFPLLHVDTRWKFRDMYAFRDRMAKELGLELLVHINPDGVAKDINPFTHGSSIHTDIMKTEGLKQALDKYGFDAAFGGARRDEEKSRAKERIFSFRTAQHRWDPKGQRPELWHLYNARKHKGESMRVFPISNWTELDIWQYIYLENIPIVPLYYSAERPVVERDGTLIMVDDERMKLRPGETPMMKKVRFRTLGCYPLTGAVESNAATLPEIIQEMLLTTTSERQGRMIDHDSAGSMEKKKQEGYF